MKVAIDYRLAALSNRGMARYARELTECLIKQYPEDEWRLLVTPLGYERVCKENPALMGYLVRLPHEDLVVAEQWGMAGAVRAMGADLLWCPYNTMPLGSLGGAKLVVTVHDLIFLEPVVGGTLRQRLGALYRRFMIRQVSKRADKLFTVSKYSKYEIANRLGLPPEKVIITFNCVDGFIRQYMYLPTNLKREDHYFTVSGDAPHKNLPMLLRYFAEHPEEKLVVAGVPEGSPIRATASANVTFLPPVSDKELVRQYAVCKAFVFISKKEGFGFPVAEAIVAKCPLLLAKAASIPEVAGYQGVYIDPDSYESLCDGFERLKVAEVNKSSFGWVVQHFFGWKNVADKVHANFKDLLD